MNTRTLDVRFNRSVYAGNPVVTSVVLAVSGRCDSVSPEDAAFSTAAGLPYPLHNVARHLVCLAAVRLYPEYRHLIDIFTVSPHPARTRIYENRRVIARLGLPLLTDDALSRIAERWWIALVRMAADTDLLKRLRLASFPTVHHRNMLDSGLPFLDATDEPVAFAGANPYLTDERAIQFVARNRPAITVPDLAAFCNNTCLSLDGIREIFRIVNGNRLPYADPDDFVYAHKSFRRAVIDRFDYPADRLTGEDLVQNSTAEHIVSYFRSNRGMHERVSVGRHPNTPDRVYNMLLTSEQDDIRSRMLFFDRTGPYHLLQNAARFKHICELRFTIEKLNDRWRHVLDRQLELAKDPDAFFPKTKAEIIQAIDSFKP